MDKKSAILHFIAQNPGVQSADINIGIGRASVGAHARSLMVAGMLIKDASNGWHIASGYVVKVEPKKLTAIDIAGDCIRKMIEAR
jgi:hypothetical protein